MSSILLIGLGKLGLDIAKKMNEMQQQIMAIDKDEKRIENAMPYVTNTLIGDSTNEDFLRSLGISSFDLCIVAIGNDFQSSLETVSQLKEMGAKKSSPTPSATSTPNSCCATELTTSCSPASR